MATFVKFKLPERFQDIYIDQYIYINPEHVAYIYSLDSVKTVITFNVTGHDNMCFQEVEGSLEEVRTKLEKS